MKFRNWSTGLTALSLALAAPLSGGCGSFAEFLDFGDDCELVIDGECIDDLFSDDDDEDFLDRLEDLLDDDD